MKILLLTLLCFWGSTPPLFAQSVQKAFQAGGPGYDRLSEFKSDASGNLYALGHFEKNISFNEIVLTSTSDRNYYLVKYNSEGKVEWARVTAIPLNSNTNHMSADFHVDDFGNITLVGSYTEGIVIDSDTLHGNRTHDVYFARYTTNGKSQWVRTLGSNTGNETGSAIDIDEHGNIYLGGTLHGEVQLGSFSKNILVPMAYAAKISQSGEIEWVQHSTYDKSSVEYALENNYSFYNLPEARCQDIRVDKNGVVIIYARIFYQDGWEGTHLYEGYDYASFIRFSNAGKLLTKNEINNYGHEFFNFFTRMDIDNEGNIYITGQEDYNPHSDGRVFVYKISPASQDWWITVEAVDEDEMFHSFNSMGTDIHVASNGKIYVTGYVREEASFFSDILVSPNGTEMFIAEISEEGKWLWVTTFNATNIIHTGGPRSWVNYNQRLTSDAAGNLYLAGEFVTSVQLGEFTLNSQGQTDIIFSKWNIEEIDTPQPQVHRFVLVDAATNKDYKRMEDNEIYFLEGYQYSDQILPPKFNIRAETNPKKVGSVVFNLNGRRIRTENEAPYALSGDRNGNYHSLTLEPGQYTLTATPYSQPNRKGIEGKPLTIHFEVKEKYIPRSGLVDNFILVDATTNQDIRQINNNDILYLDQLPANINIRANTIPKQVSYVTFRLYDSERTRYNLERTELVAPYALAGDHNGNYYSLKPRLVPGTYFIIATPTTIDENRNIWTGMQHLVHFEVKDRAMAEAGIAETSLTGSTKLLAYPNPFTQFVNLEVDTEESQITLAIYDLQGRLIKTIHNGLLPQEHPKTFTFDGSALPAGIYLSKLNTGKTTYYQKLILTK